MPASCSVDELMCLDYKPSCGPPLTSASVPLAEPIDVSGDGSLLKVVLREAGDKLATGEQAHPKPGDECTVHYHGECIG
jgi:hypothetical protein